MQTEAPAADEVPAAQGAHAEAEVAPLAELRVPAAHSVHEVAAARAYEPAAQVAHEERAPAPTELLAVPAGHCAGAAEPGGQ